jgi:uncharacterized protein YqeY
MANPNSPLKPSIEVLRERRKRMDAIYASVKNNRRDLYEQVCAASSLLGLQYNLQQQQTAHLEAVMMSLVADAAGL